PLELPHPLPSRVGGVRQEATLEDLIHGLLLLFPYDGFVDRDKTNALHLHSRYAAPSEPIRTSFEFCKGRLNFRFAGDFEASGFLRLPSPGLLSMILALVARLFLILFVPPTTDVYYYEAEAAEVLLAGSGPYAHTF